VLINTKPHEILADEHFDNVHIGHEMAENCTECIRKTMYDSTTLN